MKKVLQYLLLLSGVSALHQANAQTYEGYKLQGSPLETTGWVLSPNTTVNVDELNVVNNVASQSGYIYYGDKAKLAICREFDVTFSFRTNNSAQIPTEGLAFWYTSTLPTGFQANNGLGMPSNMTGFAAIIDAFDNDNNNNNPLLSVRNYVGANYTEGSATGLIGPDVALPANTTNGGWHDFKIAYRNGVIEIFLDNMTVPVFSGNSTIANTFEGYFGISAANSASHISTVSIKDFHVQSYPLPPRVITPLFCKDKPHNQFVYPNAGTVYWYTSKTAPDGSGTTLPPSINTADTGTYYYYAASPGNSCVGERAEYELKVHLTPIADYTFVKSEGCGADTIQFTNSSQFANTYTWDFNDGYTSILYNPEHIFAGEGTYNVALIASNEFCVDTMTQTIKLENPFSVDFDITIDSLCVGSPTKLINISNVSDKNGIPTVYHWEFGRNAGDTANVKNPPTQIYYEPGYYPVKLKVTNGIPCTDSVVKYILVDPNPELSFLRSDSIICAGDDIKFTGSVHNIGLTEYTWDFGDGSTAVTNNPIISRSFETPGTYTVSLAAKYRVCADSTYTRNVYVNAVPKINLGEDQQICNNGTPVVLKDNYNALNMNAKWSWTGSDVSTSSFVVTQPGTYTGTVTINNCSASDEVVVKKGCYIDIPNAFSPNNDGNNDYFIPRNTSDNGIKEFKMQIFDRWGGIIFETTQLEGKGWDGTLGGQILPFGVYVYNIEVTFANDATEKYTGNVTLIR